MEFCSSQGADMTMRMHFYRTMVGLVTVILVLVGSPRPSLLARDADSQLWLNYYIEGKPAETVTAGIGTDFYIDNGMSRLYSTDFELYLAVSPLSWLRIGLGYFQIYDRVESPVYSQYGLMYARQSNHYWTKESRPYADITLSAMLAGWTIQDRLRGEYHAGEGEKDYGRIRNRLRIKTPWQWTPVAINPYVAYEIFFREPSNDTDEHRKLETQYLFAGLMMSFPNRVSADLYYLKQLKWKSGAWVDVNILGINCGLLF